MLRGNGYGNLSPYLRALINSAETEVYLLRLIRILRLHHAGCVQLQTHLNSSIQTELNTGREELWTVFVKADTIGRVGLVGDNDPA